MEKIDSLDVPTKEIYQIGHELGQMIHDCREEEFVGRWHRNSSSSCKKTEKRRPANTVYNFRLPLGYHRVLLGIPH